jgi:hypothetical protein
MSDQQVQQQEQTVTITVAINELNTIIAGLDELPHKFSRGLIDKVSTQAREQLQVNQPDGPLGSKVVK